MGKRTTRAAFGRAGSPAARLVDGPLESGPFRGLWRGGFGAGLEPMSRKLHKTLNSVRSRDGVVAGERQTAGAKDRI